MLNFDSQSQSGLSLRRRGRLAPHSPMESTETLSTAPFESGGSQGPYDQSALQAAWDKLYRARALLEAEQAHLRDDRIAIQGAVDELEMREQAIAARELRIKQLEMQAMLDLEEEKDRRDSASTISKITRVPFDVARSVFGSKK